MPRISQPQARFRRETHRALQAALGLLEVLRAVLHQAEINHRRHIVRRSLQHLEKILPCAVEVTLGHGRDGPLGQLLHIIGNLVLPRLVQIDRERRE